MNKRLKIFYKILSLFLVFFIVSGMFLYQPRQAQAATYTATQSSWTGGATANTAVHPTNQTGWTQYSTSTSGIAASTAVQLASTTYSFTDDGATSTTSGSATGGGFSNGTNSNTIIYGSGTNTIIQLNRNNSSFLTETITSGGAGVYSMPTSISAEDSNNIFISYSDPDPNLNFAKSTNGGASWATSTVDSVGGQWDSISTVGTSTIFISYYRNSALAFAKSINGGASWTTATIDSGNNVGQHSSIFAADANTIFIAYFDDTNDDLLFAKSTNGGSSWATSTVASAGSVGWYSAIHAADSNNIFIAYNDEGSYSLLSARSTNGGSSFATSTVQSGGVVSSTKNNSVFAISSSTIFISYYSDTDLLFAKSVNGGSSFATSIIDSGGTVGQYSSISAIDSNNIFISYYDYTNTNLNFAKSTNGGSSWATSTIDNSADDVGKFTSISTYNADNSFISYVNETNKTLKLAKHPYYSSGSFTSATIDLGGNSEFNTLSYASSSQVNTTISVKVRSDSNSDMSGAAAWASCSAISNGASLSSGGCVTNGHRYVQYQAALSTSDTNLTPSLNSVTVNYAQYATSGDLTSSAYDTGDAANVLSKIQWTESLATSTDVKFQLRTSSNGSSWSGWCGPDDGTPGSCASSTYFTDPTGGETVDDILRDGSNDKWIQYKAFLTSGGGYTPTLSSTTLTYVVNAPPDFDSSYGTGGISVSQNSTDTDYDSDGASDLGEILLIYSVRDTDTNSGTVNPGKIQPSFQYRLNSGSSWTAVATSSLNTGAYSLKNVSQTAYTSTSTTVNASTTTALWDAVGQLGTNIFSTTTQIKVLINDNEGANNSASSTSAVFTLDTKAPSATLTIDSSAGAATGNVISYNFSDDSNVSYIFSNSVNLSADGSNALSGSWIAANATSTNASSTWTLAGAPNDESVYYRAKDIYGNMTATTTAVAPAIGSQNASAINIKDISNVSTGEWREFISWSPFIATSGAAFSSYRIHRSTDGTTYNSLATITASSTNYYTDTSVSSSTTYYYKVRFVDTGGDISEFSASVNDYVDGQGGTDVTAPIISNVSSTLQSTWVKITWTTDEYSDSKVEYSTNAGVFTSSVFVETIVASTTPHTVYLTSLTPNTTYYYRVKSKDIVNNEATNPTSGNGYSFTTIGGPVISNVSCLGVSDNSADVIWNTTADSNSQVDYSVSSGLTNATSVSAGMVGTSTAGYYQHKITLSGLTQGTTYYFRVQSTDSNNNISVENNSGNFYQCRTTRDTKAPAISGISTPVITDTAVVIIWTTDEKSTSQVEYGQVSAVTGSYATTTTRDNTLTINHIVTLTGLTKEIKYYYRVKSYDMNPDSPTAVSDEQNFTSAAEKQTIIVYVSSGSGGGSDQQKDTTAPLISGIEVADIGAFGATVNFNTNEQTTAFVNYGEKIDYGYNVGSSEFNSSHKIKLTGLKMGTYYNFKIKAIDKSGNYSYSDNQIFKTKYFSEALEDLVTLENASQFQEAIEKSIESILPSILPPFIEKPRVSDITENSAVVKWKTNIQSYSAVAFAPEKDYFSESENPYISEVSNTDEKTKEHEIALIGLDSNTKYHFMAKSFALPQVVGKSADLVFITKAPKIAPRVVDIDKDAVRIVWTTAEKSSSIVEYKNLRTGEILRKIDETKITDHDVKIENLDPGTSYEINVTGYNEKDNLIETGELLTVKTSRDIAPPEISNIRIDGALVPGRTDRVQTVVSWRTDEPANSIVEYEEGSGKSGEELMNKVSDIGAFTNIHTIIIAKLKPGTLYRVKIISVDEAGNKTVSPIRTIITPRQSESIVDVIVKNFEETFQFLKKLK